MEQADLPVPLTGFNPELYSTSELLFSNYGVKITPDYSSKVGGNALPTAVDTGKRMRFKYVTGGTFKGDSPSFYDSIFQHNALVGALHVNDCENELKRLGDEISSDMKGNLYEPFKAVTSLKNAYNDDQLLSLIHI